ncbi:hypothetical protein CDCA_CDCA13G3570 [Cyanidium caldarium]|uniref:Elongation factor G, mitochondrial n=1 Tax=Cyanidium caldarium TaxID=2771 RepID=A0AAV9IYY5_CYACA|nr:hypothetical protein CDCA_CDCA13G3570 [Cyanidium caldarium]
MRRSANCVPLANASQRLMNRGRHAWMSIAPATVRRRWLATEAAADAPPPPSPSDSDAVLQAVLQSTREAATARGIDGQRAPVWQRNFGIAAHIDSGKTTLTERVLFYAGRIRKIHEVRGKDGVGATMDSMELERERGITIASAATYCSWRNGVQLNLIDTPGHVDFTIEVERALRVLDGAVLVVCGASGVQSQSLTVDRQMKRHRVPRLTFINKLDRMGADPWRALRQLNERLRMPAAFINLPIGLERDLEGVVDVIRQCAVYFDGEHGERVRVEESLPPALRATAEQARRQLIERLANVDEPFGDCFLQREYDVPEAALRAALRRATIARRFSPVLCGSALKNIGVQPVLDAVVDYLPSPLEVESYGMESRGERRLLLQPDAAAPLVSLAFKLEEGRFGQLTYLRVYQGTLRRGDNVFNARTGKKVKVPRLMRMHADEMQDVEEARAGDICAMFGLECASGDTFTDETGKVRGISLESLHVPEPVMSLAITPKNRQDVPPNFSKALNRFTREDPTFRVHVDPESKQTIISGMGELHLEIYVERMRREYGVECEVGQPKVNYRETVTRRGGFQYLHRKQSGGAGQYGGVQGYIEPMHAEEADAATEPVDPTANEFVNALVGNNIPPQFLPAIERGFHEAVAEGALTGHRVQGVRMVLQDGKSHPVDSNEIAFRTAALMGFRHAFADAGAVVLEPIMRVAVQAPPEQAGDVIAALTKRRGTIMQSQSDGDAAAIEAEVPLHAMFGYTTELRSLTQGKGEYTMEYVRHAPCTREDQERLAAQYAGRRKGQSA